MDMSFANLALAVEHLVLSGDSLEHRVLDVPKEIDDEIARLKLESLRVEIDTLTPDQEEYLSSWSGILASMSERNVLGEKLAPCGMDPVTGFYRDGCCRTGADDLGSHDLRRGHGGVPRAPAGSATISRRPCPAALPRARRRSLVRDRGELDAGARGRRCRLRSARLHARASPRIVPLGLCVSTPSACRRARARSRTEGAAPSIAWPVSGRAGARFAPHGYLEAEYGR